MSKGAHLISFQVLRGLGESLGRFSSKALEGLGGIQAETRRRVDVLEKRHAYYTEELHYLRRAYEDADDDEEDDREAILHKMEEVEEDLREVQYWMRQVEECLVQYMRHARAVHDIATTRTPKATHFLHRKLSELYAYINTQADAPSGGSGGRYSAGSSAVSTGSAHTAAYNDFRQQHRDGNVRFMPAREVYVNEGDIMSPEHTDAEWDQRQANFWTHHGNTFEGYNEMADKFRLIQSHLAKGKTLDELRLDESMRPAIEFWWSKSEPVKLYKYKGSYWVDSGFHRVTLAKNHHLGAIPAMVTEAELKKS